MAPSDAAEARGQGAPLGEPPPRASVRALLDAGVTALRTRLELAAVELEIHLLSLVRLLVWLMAALACALLALVFGVATLILALWDTHRTAGLLGATGLFVGLAALCAGLCARILRRQPRILEGSLAQLREDQRRAQDGS
jgi:uncharacterized membrane protein YqjE